MTGCHLGTRVPQAEPGFAGQEAASQPLVEAPVELILAAAASSVNRLVPFAAFVLLAGCAAPDGKALKKIACEQAAATIDLQSVAQLDALRKALGVAPDVDPINACKELGANMEPREASPMDSESK